MFKIKKRRFSFSNYKENWLLKLTLVLFLLSILLHIHTIVSRQDLIFEENILTGLNGINAIYFILSAVIIAPIYEELAFRAVILKNKYWVILGFIIMGVFIYSSFKPIMLILYVLNLVYYLFWKFKYKEVHWVKSGFFILNALTFAVAHIGKSTSLFSYEALTYILPTLYSSFVYIWAALNFNLLASMLLHMIHNGILMLIWVLTWQTSDSEVFIVENDSLRIEWQTKGDFYFNSFYESLNDSTQVYKNWSLEAMLIEHDDKYEPTDPQAVYDIQITIKGSLMREGGEEYSENVYKLLLEEGLMKEKATSE